jgi:hypothetical protein
VLPLVVRLNAGERRSETARIADNAPRVPTRRQLARLLDVAF